MGRNLNVERVKDLEMVGVIQNEEVHRLVCVPGPQLYDTVQVAIETFDDPRRRVT